MDTTELNTLLKLKEQLIPVKEKCDIESSLILEDMKESNNLDVLSLGRLYAKGIKLLFMQQRMYRKVKKVLVNMALFEEDEIALDINELVSMQGRAKALIGPITYTSSIPLEYLTNLEFIWSDADFSKLYNSDVIKNLRVCFGPLIMGYISNPIALNITADIADFTKTIGQLNLPKYAVALNDIKVANANSSIPLQTVRGNIHITEDEEVDPSAFSNINSFDGVVYYDKVKKIVSEGNIYSLEEYLSQTIKKYI